MKTQTNLTTYLKHFFLLLLIWYILTDGNEGSLLFGIPATFIALFFLYRLFPVSATSVSISSLILFIFYFLKQSFLSGFDVAYRAFHPKKPLEPDFIKYRCHDLPPVAKMLFICVISLLPGTLSTKMSGETLTIHVLDRTVDNQAALLELEHKIKKVFV